MPESQERRCQTNCLECGKCTAVCGDFPILDTYLQSAEPKTQMRETFVRGYGTAIDIGTTTVVMALLDLKTGAIKARRSFFNPQRVYAGDVISRIRSANEGFLEKMRQLITESIIGGLGELLKAGGITGGISSIDEMVIAGNTVMIHLLLGLPCESLGVSPFKINHTLKDIYSFNEIFALNNSAAPCSLPQVKIIPWLSAFVGGDITSGLLSVLPEKKKRFLFIDLGTNGEIALFYDGETAVTSSAAGPAFEGLHAPGASAQERSADGTAKAVCLNTASGVIKCLAESVREGKIDKTGLLRGQTVFSQKQIRDLQLAKSAVRSAIDILLEYFNERQVSGLDYYSLDTVYFAGGIGQAINSDDAVTIGLIPQEFSGKCCAAGNTSLAGAVRTLVSPLRATEDTKRLVSAFKEINLGGHPRFNDLFAQYMFF